MIQTTTHAAGAALNAPASAQGYSLAALPDALLIPLMGAVVVIAATLIGIVFATWIRRAVRDSTATLTAQLEQLHSALAASDDRVAALAARQDEQSRTTQGGSSTSYNVAIRMARSGASRQELMTTCGVTQQEADLVLRLHSVDPGVRSAA